VPTLILHGDTEQIVPIAASNHFRKPCNRPNLSVAAEIQESCDQRVVLYLTTGTTREPQPGDSPLRMRHKTKWRNASDLSEIGSSPGF
jgi:hypothetical protein